MSKLFNREPISAETWETPKTIWNAMFISVFLSSFLLNLSQQMSNSNLSIYAKSDIINAASSQIGILSSAFAITAFIFRFVSGPAMKSFNRKRLMAMAMGFMTIAYLGFSFSPKIAAATGIAPINVLIFFRLIQGLGNAFGNSCAMTIVADFIPKDKFSTGMGYFALGQAIAQAIGPKIGTALSSAFGFEMTYLIIAGCMLFAIVVQTLIVANVQGAKIPFKLKLDDMVAKEAIIPAVIVFLVAVGFTSINAFMLVYAGEYGIESTKASTFFTIYAAALFLTRPVIGKLTDKVGFVKIGTVAVALTAVSLVLIGVSCYIHAYWLLMLTALINSCGYGAAQPALQSLCIKSVTPERRGSGSATYYIGMDGGTIVGPIICGAVAGYFGYTPIMWIAVAIPVMIGAVLVVVFHRQITKIETDFAARAK